MFRQTCITFKMKYEKEMALLFSGNDERINVKVKTKHGINYLLMYIFLKRLKIFSNVH